MAADSQVCTICGEPAPSAALSTCHSCGEQFHLNERNDVDGKDCGQVWIDEQFLALRFACQRCIDADGTAPGHDSEQPKPVRTGRRRYRRRD